eukprot:3932734-Rhodomonas_salina.2
MGNSSNSAGAGGTVAPVGSTAFRPRVEGMEGLNLTRRAADGGWGGDGVGGKEDGGGGGEEGVLSVCAAHNSLPAVHGMRYEFLPAVSRAGEGGALGHQLQLPGVSDRVEQVAERGGGESAGGDGAGAVGVADARALAQAEHVAAIPQARRRVSAVVRGEKDDVLPGDHPQGRLGGSTFLRVVAGEEGSVVGVHRSLQGRSAFLVLGERADGPVGGLPLPPRHRGRAEEAVAGDAGPQGGGISDDDHSAAEVLGGLGESISSAGQARTGGPGAQAPGQRDSGFLCDEEEVGNLPGGRRKAGAQSRARGSGAGVSREALRGGAEE